MYANSWQWFYCTNEGPVFEALLPCYNGGLGFVTRIDLLSRD